MAPSPCTAAHVAKAIHSTRMDAAGHAGTWHEATGSGWDKSLTGTKPSPVAVAFVRVATSLLSFASLSAVFFTTTNGSVLFQMWVPPLASSTYRTPALQAAGHKSSANQPIAGRHFGGMRRLLSVSAFFPPSLPSVSQVSLRTHGCKNTSRQAEPQVQVAPTSASATPTEGLKSSLAGFSQSCRTPAATAMLTCGRYLGAI